MRKSSLIKKIPNTDAVLFEVKNNRDVRRKDAKPHLFYFWKRSHLKGIVSICINGSGMADIVITRDALKQMLAAAAKEK